jgi:hypothetical protein
MGMDEAGQINALRRQLIDPLDLAHKTATVPPAPPQSPAPSEKPFHRRSETRSRSIFPTVLSEDIITDLSKVSRWAPPQLKLHLQGQADRH